MLLHDAEVPVVIRLCQAKCRRIYTAKLPSSPTATDKKIKKIEKKNVRWLERKDDTPVRLCEDPRLRAKTKTTGERLQAYENYYSSFSVKQESDVRPAIKSWVIVLLLLQICLFYYEHRTPIHASDYYRRLGEVLDSVHPFQLASHSQLQ